ncbi:MAG: hypothetical protein ACKO0N_01815 [Planctomycetota bacterium]
MPVTPLRKLHRSIGKNLAQDKRTCTEMIAGLKRSTDDNLASLFAESLEINSELDGIGQPYLNTASLKTRTKLTPGSRGDNRIVYLLSERERIGVTNGPRGYSFRYVGRQLPRFRKEGAGAPKSGAGGIDYTAVSGSTPVLGEIKRSGDKNPFYAFVQLLTYLSEMATPNQVRRATKYEEFGIPLKDSQPFDLHILLTDVNKRSATLGLIEPTRQLAELFRGRLGKQHGKLLGKTLCLEMDSATFAASPDSTLECLWVA